MQRTLKPFCLTLKYSFYSLVPKKRLHAKQDKGLKPEEGKNGKILPWFTLRSAFANYMVKIVFHILPNRF